MRETRITEQQVEKKKPTVKRRPRKVNKAPIEAESRPFFEGISPHLFTLMMFVMMLMMVLLMVIVIKK